MDSERGVHNYNQTFSCECPTNFKTLCCPLCWYLLLSSDKNFKTQLNIKYTLTYQDEPCGSHGPRQTQQKSALQFWFLHTIWLQPPSFSMVTLHFGHSWKYIKPFNKWYLNSLNTHYNYAQIKNRSIIIWEVSYKVIYSNDLLILHFFIF
jgi:hypothetical protein